MAEEKAQSNTIPADLNELKQRIEERGTDWGEALATLKVATGCKDIAHAIQEGWTIKRFWDVLGAISRAAEPTQAPKEEPTAPDLTPALQPICLPAGNGHTEAPASFNVKAISPAGFDIMLTLRANDTGELLGRIEKALAWLTTHKFTPTSARNSGANGPSANSGDGKQKYCTQKRDDAGFCPVHGKEMKKSQHHPGYYCPTRV